MNPTPSVSNWTAPRRRGWCGCRTWRDRLPVLVAVAFGLLVFAAAPLAQKSRKGAKNAEPTEEELKKAYEETEVKVSTGSTDDRPGLAPWKQIQGKDLAWPAKYYLPWPAGVAHEVYQGWNGNGAGPPTATHMQPQNYYAWDFHIERGQYICAARDGKVSFVHDSEAAGLENDNCLRIDHIDGEVSVYAHVGSNTALVKEGDRVLAGQKICQGSSESKHLHFVIWKGMIDYPCRFLDYKANNGVPQGGGSVVSGNVGTPEETLQAIRDAFAAGETAFAAGDYPAALKQYRTATAQEIWIDEYEQALGRIEECRAKIDEEVTAAVEEARKGDFEGAEKRFRDLKKRYGDAEAEERIDKALEEFKNDPAFQAWLKERKLGRMWADAEAAEEKEDWDRAIDLYKELRGNYDKTSEEYKDLKKRISRCQTAKALED